MKIDLNYLGRCIIIASNAASDIVEAKKKYDNEEEIVDLNDLDMAPDDIRHQWKAASLEIMCMFEISYTHVDYVMELVEKLICDVYKLTNTAEKYAKDFSHGSILTIPSEMICIFEDAKCQLAYKTVVSIAKLKESRTECNVSSSNQ